MQILSKIRSCLSHTKIDFMAFHKIALVMSVVCILVSVILVFTKGLNFGIDFAGGILIEVRIDEKADVSSVRQMISEKIKDVQIQNFGKNPNNNPKEGEKEELLDQTSGGVQDLLIRVAKVEEDQSVTIKKIQEILEKNFTKVEYRKIDYVGPQVGSEMILKGVMALLLSFIFIMIYIWVRFDWQFGLGGIFALFHDAVLTLGFFSLTGLEFNLTSIAAILTIIGYSINDSVVIYDRIRENMHRFKRSELSEVINSSTNSTLSRTVLTAGATLASILALIFFGGEVLKSFSIATFFGIVIGTYSSIYISAPILIYLNPGKKNHKEVDAKK